MRGLPREQKSCVRALLPPMNGRPYGSILSSGWTP